MLTKQKGWDGSAGQARSDDGLVTVTVNAAGVVTGTTGTSRTTEYAGE